MDEERFDYHETSQHDARGEEIREWVVFERTPTDDPEVFDCDEVATFKTEAAAVRKVAALRKKGE